MNSEYAEQTLQSSLEFFERSSRCLTEADSAAKPAEGMWTAAQQVAHVAQTVDWFVDGVASPTGFSMEFEKLSAELNQVTSITAAREHVKRAYANAIQYFKKLGPEGLMKPLPPGPIMGGAPIIAVIGAIVEHTAHHRGALTVYSRLAGKVPPMPYGEM